MHEQKQTQQSDQLNLHGVIDTTESDSVVSARSQSVINTTESKILHFESWITFFYILDRAYVRVQHE